MSRNVSFEDVPIEMQLLILSLGDDLDRLLFSLVNRRYLNNIRAIRFVANIHFFSLV